LICTIDPATTTLRSLRSLKGSVKRSGLLKESLTSHESECRWITVGSVTLIQLMNESSRQYGDEQMSGQSSDPSDWSEDNAIKQRTAEN